MVDNNDELYRAVEEEMRRERYERLWKQYGGYAIGAAAAIIFVVAGYQYSEHAALTATQTAGANYEKAIAALTDKKPEDANAKLTELTKDAPPGYATLAGFSLVGSELSTKDKATAMKTLETLSIKASVDPLLKDFAKLQLAALKIDDASFTEIKNQLSPLTSETGPWRHLAKEYLAMAAMKAKKNDEARELLSALLIDPKLTRQARERVNRMMGMIAASELAPAAPAKTTAAPAKTTEAPAKKPEAAAAATPEAGKPATETKDTAPAQ